MRGEEREGAADGVALAAGGFHETPKIGLENPVMRREVWQRNLGALHAGPPNGPMATPEAISTTPNPPSGRRANLNRGGSPGS
jgi:hypothetical protein